MVLMFHEKCVYCGIIKSNLPINYYHHNCILKDKKFIKLLIVILITIKAILCFRRPLLSSLGGAKFLHTTGKYLTFYSTIFMKLFYLYFLNIVTIFDEKVRKRKLQQKLLQIESIGFKVIDNDRTCWVKISNSG